MTEPIRLTQYSHGAGCGCKISPKVLDIIVAGSGQQHLDPRLWVGNASRDDAAVYAIDEERGVVSTTDFFMPIVDDPFDFGRIAATNAISDIYAMGGTPLMAIAILGWPVNVLPPEVAREVVRGGRSVCEAAGIPLAGGHSIDAPEPIFGLAVTGLVEKQHMKRNDTAEAGCRLYLTKPLGVGILTTAEKRGLLEPAMAERRVPQIVRQRDRFHQIFVQAQIARQRTADLRHFQTMGQPRAEQIALVVEEHLRLVLEPAECRRVDDAVTVTLEFTTRHVRRFGKAAPHAARCVGGIRGEEVVGQHG